MLKHQQDKTAQFCAGVNDCLEVMIEQFCLAVGFPVESRLAGNAERNTFMLLERMAQVQIDACLKFRGLPTSYDREEETLQ